MVKSLYTVLFFLAVASISHAADIGERHASFCKTDEAKAAMGKGGSCRITAVIKDVGPFVGECQGNYKNLFNCNIVFGALSGKGPGMVSISCGKDPSKPLVNEEMPAEVIVYEVVASIKTKKKKRTILTDKNIYTVISSQLVTLQQTETPSADGTSTVTRSATIELTKPVDLKDFSCK